MCGIVAYVGPKDCSKFILDGIEKLQYRGYDSFGYTYEHYDGSYRSVRKLGKYSAHTLKPFYSTIAIGHTRWATHGKVTLHNTHPITSNFRGVQACHNGIIDNYKKLAEEMGLDIDDTETDTKVLANFLALRCPLPYPKHDVLDNMLRISSVMRRLYQIQGHSAFVALFHRYPGLLVGFSRGSPLLISQEGYIASDEDVLRPYTNNIYRLKDNELVLGHQSLGSLYVSDLCSSKIEIHIPTYNSINQSTSVSVPSTVDGSYMYKEILEQADTVQKAYEAEIKPTMPPEKVLLFGCGSSWHAALLGQYYIESIANIPAEACYASELLYRPILQQPKGTHYIGITQSGETADTLASLQRLYDYYFPITTIVNKEGSKATTYNHIKMGVGPEIGVASTKTFTASCILLLRLAELYRLNGMAAAKVDDSKEVLSHAIKELFQSTLQMDRLKTIAKSIAQYKHILFLAKGYNFPIALEGALKMKEVSYIHAEALPAAEIKHGPIALIDDNTLSIFIVTNQDYGVPQKVISNMQEIKARGGKIGVITDARTCESVWKVADWYFCLPTVHWTLQPILANIPLQLLAYYTALELGRDVDKPRNLAKSVTVE
jgi:glucosamine--fructose-6-phosphate aminotransferase (isomerizing)